MDAFGIKIVGTAKSKSKMQHAAQILAELLDNDNDGCPDDVKAFGLLAKGSSEHLEGKVLKPVLLIYDKNDVTDHLGNDAHTIIENSGYYVGQLMGNWEVNPCGRSKLFTSNVIFLLLYETT